MSATAEGIARAELGAAPSWLERAYEAGRTVAARGGTFTADDVWEALGETPTTASTPTSAAMGPVLLRLKREGIAHPTDRILPPSARRTSENGHQNVRVWEAS